MLIILTSYVAYKAPYIMDDPNSHIIEKDLFLESYDIFYYDISEFSKW